MVVDARPILVVLVGLIVEPFGELLVPREDAAVSDHAGREFPEYPLQNLVILLIRHERDIPSVPEKAAAGGRKLRAEVVRRITTEGEQGVRAGFRGVSAVDHREL